VKYTKAANAHVEAIRTGTAREATWFDVAAAYDAGLLHGANRHRDAQDQLVELGTVTREMLGHSVNCKCARCRYVSDVQAM
jgi:hypothetical protein